VSGWQSGTWRKDDYGPKRRAVPKFKTEGEEAKWWYANRGKVEQALITAMDNGTIRRGTAQRLTREARASRNVTIRIADADLDLARKQADKKGLPYQTYIYQIRASRSPDQAREAPANVSAIAKPITHKFSIKSTA
jgi:predicted DNA binding CopG/RHH family protein